MQTENTMTTSKKTDNSRNSVITIKVSNSEKALLQEMADDVDLSLSEYIRLKGLSTLNSVTNYERELDIKENVIKKLKIALAFYDGNKADTPGIALPLTSKQTFYLMDVFANYYGTNTPIEQQIVRYLIEDLFTYHYNFEKRTIIDIGLKTNNTLIPVGVEAPFKNSSNPDELLNAFREYGIFSPKAMNQLKSTTNKYIIDESWKQSEE